MCWRYLIFEHETQPSSVMQHAATSVCILHLKYILPLSYKVKCIEVREAWDQIHYFLNDMCDLVSRSCFTL